ncbi:flagellar assembly protein FliW [Paenisporosarcina cavernae]|uniref:Flagellar assembly factor FliW n=1 Tax=Paenisporosarcina cavernae TaxID=2320858 RepID=A0A385YR22_9BACL|nr:flagellar assembly protein FliW [Paenisporosarcina cavernae]AYC28944.1 flagellar assembly protein FliW [Paenisporosarcina cavernae]
MLIETKFFGSTEITENQIINFPEGILGFEEYNKFAMIPVDSESPFIILQSINEKQIGFVMAYPFLFNSQYEFDVSDLDKKELGIEKLEDVSVYSLVTLKEVFEESTMNLLSPIIINSKKNLGKQIVLNDQEKYPLRYLLSKGGV